MIGKVAGWERAPLVKAVALVSPSPTRREPISPTSNPRGATREDVPNRSSRLGLLSPPALCTCPRGNSSLVLCRAKGRPPFLLQAATGLEGTGRIEGHPSVLDGCTDHRRDLEEGDDGLSVPPSRSPDGVKSLDEDGPAAAPFRSRLPGEAEGEGGRQKSSSSAARSHTLPSQLGAESEAPSGPSGS